MHVYDGGLHHAAARVGAQHLIDGGKRIAIGLFHEHLTQRLRHQQLATAARLEHAVPPPRNLAACIIQWPQDARLGLDELKHVLLIEGMISQCDAISARFQQQLGMGTRKPHSIGSVFPVYHHEIQLPRLAQARQLLLYGGTPRAPHHITKKKYLHGATAYSSRTGWTSGKEGV